MAVKFVEDITPTEEQSRALEAIHKFKRSSKRFFLLSGGAGRGKTAVIKKSFLRPARGHEGKYTVPDSVMGITLAHMARLVLSKSIPNSKSYASAVGVGLVLSDEDLMATKFSVLKDFSKKHFDKVRHVVFDEASMVGVREINRLLECIRPDCKIIFMGDRRQLPQIGIAGDEDSRIFNIEDKFHLTQPIRQTDDSAIFALSERIGEMLDGTRDYTDFNKLPKRDIRSDGKGYSFTSKPAAIESFVHNFKQGKDVRITSFRNNTIKGLNKQIRGMLWGEDAEMFVPGDLLIGKNQYNPYRSEERPWHQPLFYNGQLMKVEAVNTSSGKFVNVKGIGDEWYKNELWDVLKGGIQFHSLTCEGIEKPVRVVKQHELGKYYKALDLLKAYGHESGRMNLWQEFAAKFAAVGYGYASTLYSIQGSTHNTVYVDMSDVKECKALSTKRRLQSLYVGFTRPTNNLAIF